MSIAGGNTDKVITSTQLIEMTENGKIFGVQFTKKNGDIRTMQARRKVSALIKDADTRLAKGVRAVEDARNNVLTVYDMAKVIVNEDGEDVRGAFRRINLDTIIYAKIGGTEYTVQA